jgi:hypothetical protein
MFKLARFWILIGLAVVALGACGSSAKSASRPTGPSTLGRAPTGPGTPPRGGVSCVKKGSVGADSSGTILYCKPGIDGRLQWGHPRNRISVIVALPPLVRTATARSLLD